MRVGKFQSVGCAVCLSLLVSISGCGGDKSGFGGGGTGNTVMSYDLIGFSGFLENDVVASATPQTVNINVDGNEQVANGVIVTNDCAKGTQVTLLQQGTKLLNCTIANPAAGLTIQGSAITAPVNSDGSLPNAILTGSKEVKVTTPPATWQGHSFPAGFTVDFSSTVQGGLRSTVNSTLQYPDAVSVVTGEAAIAYISQALAGHLTTIFDGADSSQIALNNTLNSAPPSSFGIETVGYRDERKNVADTTWSGTITAVFDNQPSP